MSLSDKIPFGQDMIWIDDVKQFIKDLKEKAEEYEWEGSEIINELAGEGLI